MADIMATDADNVPVQIPLKRVFYLQVSSSFRIKDVRVFTWRPTAKAGTYFKPGSVATTGWSIR